MARPRKPAPDFSPDGIFGRMTPGIVYQTRLIAGWFELHPNAVRAFLAQLCEQGLIERRQCIDKSHGYMRPKEAAALNTSIAGPQLAPDLRSTLSGYDAEMRERVALAMCARRAA